MTPEGKIINNRFPILHSDPDGYMRRLNAYHPGYIHTWERATPDEIRRNMMLRIYH
jgi:hypothetical protein